MQTINTQYTQTKSEYTGNLQFEVFIISMQLFLFLRPADQIIPAQSAQAPPSFASLAVRKRKSLHGNEAAKTPSHNRMQ